MPQKAEEISRTWKIYDYRSLRFRIEEIRSQSPGNAFAKVIWEGETRNRSTHEIKELNKTYLVWFTNDSGQWRIKSLEKARPARGAGKILMRSWRNFRAILFFTLAAGCGRRLCRPSASLPGR